jgi:hypothetical protein
MFFQWIDRNGEVSNVFTFTDRNGQGAMALGHNSMMPHSIRGKVSDDKEGL